MSRKVAKNERKERMSRKRLRLTQSYIVSEKKS